VNPGDPNEPVVLDLVLSDETFHQTDPLTRWQAQWIMRRMGEWDQQPFPGKRVVQALIVPVLP
jgi:hypothetical protein